MTDLFEKLLARIPGADLVSKNSKLGKLISTNGVTRSGEWLRIDALPRRDWQTASTLDEMAARLTEHLAIPGGTMRLWPVQAQALADAHDCGGAFLPIGVGQGKALISLLAASVIACKRPLLVVPAALRDQTVSRVLPAMRAHWRINPTLRVIGYSEISLVKNADMLESIAPDLLILDEGHYLRNKTAGRTKRVVWYLRDHPDTTVIAMSGTFARKSLRDYWHILLWCLRQGAPVPRDWRTLCQWADAIDLEVPDQCRVGPGALMRWAQTDEGPREAYGRRLRQTHGVVATDEKELGVSLEIVNRPLELPKVVNAALKKLRDNWETPGGDWCTETIEVWRHAQTIALGFYFVWDPPAPAEWAFARKAYNTFVRETLAHNRRQLATPLQVWNECAAQCLPAGHPFLLWRKIKSTFVPNPVVRWFSEHALQDAASWLKCGGIVWTQFAEFGSRLGRVAGVSYLGGGADASRAVLDITGPVVLSIAAHSEGKNLQDRYCENLIVAPPSSGKTWEQILGRTHREGQQADTVTVHTYLCTDESRAAFEKARDEAAYIEQTGGGRQKLGYADIVI